MTLAKRAMLGVVLIVVIGSSQAQLEPMEWRGVEMAQSSGRLTLKLKEKLSRPSPLKSAFYVHKSGLAMIAAGGYSADNGRTWTPLIPQPDFDSQLPKGYRRELFPGFLDPVTNRLIRIVNSMDTPGLDPNIEEPPVALKTYYLRYRVSTDGGKTYLGDHQIIQKGNYTEEHPFKGVWKGKNAIFLGDLGCQPIRTRQGKILVPAQVCTLGADGNLSSPGGGFTYTDVLVLIGQWVEGNKLEWEISQRVEADPAASTRGMIEPTLAEMPDGRILMVMRGSNGGSKDPEFKISGYRWYSASSDGGYHWTKPQPWTYDDGARFFSPSSMSQLISHSNGRYYWIGNISPTNPRGNNPRYPLVIGEVDSKSLTLIKGSVITIDTLQPDDKDGVELSNFMAFEDRETGDIVLPMERWKGGYKGSEPFIYRIGVG